MTKHREVQQELAGRGMVDKDTGSVSQRPGPASHQQHDLEDRAGGHCHTHSISREPTPPYEIPSLIPTLQMRRLRAGHGLQKGGLSLPVVENGDADSCRN